MSCFTSMEMFCCVCGTRFGWTPVIPFANYMVCSRECYKEFEWRRTLSLMNKPYEPDPNPAIPEVRR